MATCKHDGCDKEAYKDKPYCSKCFNEHYKGKGKKGEEAPVAVDSPGGNEKPVELKPAEPKKPERFEIEERLVGRDGLYNLDVQVIVYNGPLRSMDVRISEEMKREWETILVKGRTYFDKTDVNGFLSIPLNPDGFEEERRKIVVQLIGTTTDYPIYLDGPKRQWGPTSGAGLLANFRSLAESKRSYSR